MTQKTVEQNLKCLENHEAHFWKGDGFFALLPVFACT